MLSRLPQRLVAKAALVVSISLLMLLFSSVVSGHAEDTKMESYQIELETNPVVVSSEEPFTLTLKISNSEDSKPVTEFDEVHTKLLHLIAVSEDLTTFLHLHPDYKGDGMFVLENADLPKAANYILFADFTPTGSVQQVVRLELSTANAQASEPELAAGEQEARVETLYFRLDFLPDDLKANEETSLRFHVTDAVTGEPINTLDEYLGAAGHLVIINEAGEIYLHTHPAGHDMAGMAGMQMEMTYGPDIEFMTEFPATGLYKMWLQVQYEGDIYTAPFVIDVAHEADSMATQEAHHH
jgi:hypothetical protein